MILKHFKDYNKFMFFFSLNVAASSTIPVASFHHFLLLPHFDNSGLSSPLVFALFFCVSLIENCFFRLSQSVTEHNRINLDFSSFVALQKVFFLSFI